MRRSSGVPRPSTTATFPARMTKSRSLARPRGRGSPPAVRRGAARFGQRRELGIVQAGIGPLEIGCLLDVPGGLGDHARAGMLVTRP